MKKLGINFTIFTGTLLVCFGILELLIRGLNPIGEAQRSSYHFDGRYDGVLDASWLVQNPVDPKADTITIRNISLPKQKKSDVSRIFFIGDSGVQGAGVNLNSTFPLLFKTLVPSEQVEVLNAGLSNTDNVTQLNVLQDQLLPFKPDIVVLTIFMGNDITTNLTRMEGLENQSLYNFSNKLFSNSALANFIRLRSQVAMQKFNLRLNATPISMPRVDEDGISLGAMEWAEIPTYKKSYSPTIEKSFLVMEDLLKKFNSLAKIHNFQLVVSFIPTYSSIAGELKLIKWPNALKILNDSGVKIKLSDLDVQKARTRILEICKKLKIVSVDPVPFLRNKGEGIMLPKDDHLSILGHRLTAESFAAQYDAEAKAFTSVGKKNPTLSQP